MSQATHQADDVTCTDADLVALLRAGDEEAISRLVERWSPTMFRLARSFVDSPQSAEDVVQEAWLGMLSGLARFEGRSSLRTWIFGILIHKAKDRGVRERRHFTFSDFDSFDDDNADAVDPARFHTSGDAAGAWAFPPQPWDERTPEKLLASKQAFAALNQALDALPASLREVLVLKDVEGLDSKDICALLKITETNLYVRLHRARERVRLAVEAALGGARTRV